MTRQFHDPFGKCEIPFEKVEITVDARDKAVSLVCELRTSDGARHRIVLENPQIPVSTTADLRSYISGHWDACRTRKETVGHANELVSYGIDLSRRPDVHRSLRATGCRIEPW